MPLVTATLLDLIRRQIAAHGTVVWYDPERTYLDVARQLGPQDVGGAAIHRYTRERGFVWLRHELEPLWAEPLTAPSLLIYVPLARSKAEHARVEFESRQALGGLTALLSDLLGVDFPANLVNQRTGELRARLAHQILMTDFLEGLGEDAPESLQTFDVAEGSVARQAAVELARTWRNRM